MEPILGSITLFGGNFEPRGWAFCNGQTLQIEQYSALYSLLGTTYGGDGVATFQLPDLRGRVPVHAGDAGCLPRPLGEKRSIKAAPSASGRVPPHDSDVVVATVPSAFDRAQGDMSARSQRLSDLPGDTLPPGRTPTPLTGGNRTHDPVLPSLPINYIIALEGIYPSRN